MGRRESGGKAETEAQRRCCGTLILGEDQGSLLGGGVRIRVVCFLGLFSDQGKDMGIFWFLDMGRITALLR